MPGRLCGVGRGRQVRNLAGRSNLLVAVKRAAKRLGEPKPEFDHATRLASAPEEPFVCKRLIHRFAHNSERSHFTPKDIPEDLVDRALRNRGVDFLNARSQRLW